MLAVDTSYGHTSVFRGITPSSAQVLVIEKVVTSGFSPVLFTRWPAGSLSFVLGREDPLTPFLPSGCFHRGEPLTPCQILFFLHSHSALLLQLMRLGSVLSLNPRSIFVPWFLLFMTRWILENRLVVPCLRTHTG